MLAVCVTAQAAQPDRIVAPIDGTETVVLKGNVHPKALPQYDQGPVEPSMRLPYITIVIKPTANQQAGLKRFLKEQQDPSSPNYRKGLTPEQYADRFGLSRRDIGAITKWLLSQGFAIVQVARGRDWIAFAGTADLVNKVFHTEIHNYQVDEELHYANASDPSIPIALAGVVVGLRGLNDFRMKPLGLRKGAASGMFFPDITPQPFYTAGSGTYLGPDDLATIYDIAPLYAAGIDGSGTKLVIVGQSDIVMSDIANFRAGFNLPANNPTVVLVPGSPDPGTADENEADLDLEWSGAVARKAAITLVNAASSTGGVFNSAQYAVDNDLAPVISMSYGLCESGLPISDIVSFEQLLQKANAENITFVAASGDSGAAACDTNPNEKSAINGLAVSYPASSPEVTGVGGNTFSGDVNNSNQYWNSSNNANGESAISYIPETAWNDTTLVGVLEASGGGASSCAIASGSGCAGFPKPSWQAALTPKDNVRDVPDISMTASPNHDGYIVCTKGSCPTGNAAGIATAVANFSIYGGTSASTPVFAGIVTLLNQSLGNTGTGSGLGNINPTLYQAAQSASNVFHDVTTGSNIVPCTQGTKGCPTTAPFQYGYKAGQGYDQVTGLGSVDANLLVTQLTAKVGTIAALTISPASPVNFGASVTLTATVTPSSPSSQTPTGTVTFSDPSKGKLGSATLNSSGMAVFTTSTLAGSTYSITANYSGDTNFASSTSSAVPYSVKYFNVSANPTTVAVTAPGQSGSTTLTVTPLGGFNQIVTYNCTGLPTGATCTFAPASATSATLSIATTGPSASLDKIHSERSRLFYALMLPGFLGLVLSTGKKSRGAMRLLSFVAVLSLAALWMPACGGGGGSSTQSNPGTPVGTSTVTITATAGSLTAPPMIITLSVQ
jgi:subtilase family serine protease